MSLENQPYFTGDLSTIKRLCKPPDRFHTRKTRSRANIRERVDVKTLDYDTELIGGKKPQMTTDIDEFYLKELYNDRSRTEFRFKRLSTIEKLRKGFRQKIEAYYIKEQLMLDQIESLKQSKVIKKVVNTVDLYNAFLDEHKEKTHRGSMKSMQEVKKYYRTTSELQAEYDQIKSEIEPMKMKIFFIGNDYLRLSRYQLFQYLLMPMEWRVQHDHLHRNPDDGKLEDEIISLTTRETKNVWNRQNVTVEAIMDFINNVYCEQKWEMIVPFKTGKEMLVAMDILQSKSLKILSKFTYASMQLAIVMDQDNRLNKLNEKAISNYEFSTMALRKRWRILKQRSNAAIASLRELLQKPLEESFQTDLVYKLNAYLQCFMQVAATEGETGGDPKHLSTLEKFKLVEKKILNIFAAIDAIPKEVFEEMERKVRRIRKKKERIAERAYKIELNIEHTMKQLERLYAKPAERKAKVGKLKRLFLPKQTFKIKELEPLLDPLEQEYCKAFMDLSDDADINQAKFDPQVKSAITKIRNEATPFYVDRFMESLGINIKKLNPLDVENIIKDEESRLKFKDILPHVREKVKFLEYLRELQKQADIKKTSYLYDRKQINSK